jgi:hypothetical protein
MAIEEYITEDRAKVIVMERIALYEREVGTPRHEQNIRRMNTVLVLAITILGGVVAELLKH